MIQISTHLYMMLLAAALLFASFRLMLQFDPSTTEESHNHNPPIFIALLIGGIIGLVSGIVGIGGGIFLSPLMLLMHWANPKQTSASAAFFIVLNSIAGIVGRQAQANFAVGDFLPLMAAAVIGGLAGSWWGARKISSTVLPKLLAVVLAIAVTKLIITALR